MNLVWILLITLPAQEEGRALVAQASVQALKATRGDWLRAGPSALLLHPDTGKPIRKFRWSAPGKEFVPVLHRAPDGETSLYWLVASTGPGSFRPRKCLGDRADPITIPGSYQSADMRFRITTEGPPRVVRNFGPDALIAFTSRSALVHSAGIEQDGSSTRIAEAFSHSGLLFGKGRTGEITVERIRFDPNPLRAGMNTSGRITLRNETGLTCRLLLWGTISPSRGTFIPSRRNVLFWSGEVRPGNCEVEIPEKIEARIRGTIFLRIGFRILGEAPVAVGPLRTMILGDPGKTIDDVRVTGRLPGGAILPFSATRQGGVLLGRTLADEIPGLIRPLRIEWKGRSWEKGEEAHGTFSAAVYDEEMPRAVEVALRVLREVER